MNKKAIVYILGSLFILKIVLLYFEVTSNSFNAKNEVEDIKYVVYPTSHGESKFCFQPSRMADNSSMPFVELIIDSFPPFNQKTEKTSEIWAQNESFLFVVEPSYSKYARKAWRLIKLGFNFCASYLGPFLSTITTVDNFIFYGVSNLYSLYKWKSIYKTLLNLPKISHKEKIKLAIKLLLIPVGSILKVRIDLDQESKLCLTPKQFAEKLATILSEEKINGAANFNQADKLVQDFHQEEQHILIIRLWDSFYTHEQRFFRKRSVYSPWSGGPVMLDVFIANPTLLVLAIIFNIYLIKLFVKWTYILLDRVSDMKKELGSEVTVTPVLTLESNLEGNVTLESCTEKSAYDFVQR